MDIVNLTDRIDALTEKRCRERIAWERSEATRLGAAWTTPRPFMWWGERLGAARCCAGVGGRRCRRPSAVVQYTAGPDGIDGRVVLCVVCARRGGQ